MRELNKQLFESLNANLQILEFERKTIDQLIYQLLIQSENSIENANNRYQYDLEMLLAGIQSIIVGLNENIERLLNETTFSNSSVNNQKINEHVVTINSLKNMLHVKINKLFNFTDLSNNPQQQKVLDGLVGSIAKVCQSIDGAIDYAIYQLELANNNASVVQSRSEGAAAHKSTGAEADVMQTSSIARTNDYGLAKQNSQPYGIKATDQLSLEKFGLRLTPILDDGNCFYYCLARAVNQSAEKLRERASALARERLTLMQTNEPELFDFFFNDLKLTHPDNCAINNIEDYVKLVGKTLYADQFIIGLLSTFYKQTIYVFEPYSSQEHGFRLKQTYVAQEQIANADLKQPLFVLHVAGNHFHLLDALPNYTPNNIIKSLTSVGIIKKKETDSSSLMNSREAEDSLLRTGSIFGEQPSSSGITTEVKDSKKLAAEKKEVAKDAKYNSIINFLFRIYTMSATFLGKDCLGYGAKETSIDEDNGIKKTTNTRDK